MAFPIKKRINNELFIAKRTELYMQKPVLEKYWQD